MKSKIFLFAVSILVTAGAYAQKGIDTGTQYGSGQDSIECIKNLNLFIGESKNKNYKDAFIYFKKLYEECPGAHLSIYQYGADIYNDWLIPQESDVAKRDILIDELMLLFDNRIKYFGDRKNFGKDWIISRKAQSYNQYKGEKTDHNLIYQWTGEAVNEFGDKTEASAVSLYVFSSLKLMQNDESLKERYIEDFLKASAIFEAGIATAKAANNDKEVDNITSRKSEMEGMFTTSGAADCETLQSIYAPKVEENKDNLEFLKKTMAIFYSVNCSDADVSVAASEYAHKIEPTAESAATLGIKAYKSGDYATAEKLFEQSIEMSDNSERNAGLYYLLSGIAMDKKQYSKVKQLALKCLKENPNYGRAYISIAHAYAYSARSIYPDDAVLYKCVYFAAIDKLEKARQVDPSVADDARRFIAQYKEYLPSAEDMFFHPDLKGETFTIGGWIGETVKIK